MERSTAEVLDRLLNVGGRIWRFVRNATVIAIAIGIVAGAGFLVMEYLHSQQVARITVAVSNSCAIPDHPLEIRIANRSSKIVENTVFYIEARIPGHSSDLVTDGRRSTDRIIKPGEEHKVCWKLPPLKYDLVAETLTSLVWSAKWIDPTFAK